MAQDNKPLGQFNLEELLLLEEEYLKLKLFDIDANGIVNVSAKDKATAKNKKLQFKHLVV